MYSLLTHTFQFNDKTITLLIPDKEAIQTQYLRDKELAVKDPLFVLHEPYWAKLWPAAIALCNYIAANTQLIQDKKVYEIAAGLGLPSLLSAHYAAEVHCSDYHKDAVETMKQSVLQNQLANVFTSVLDWQDIPANFKPEVLLLSDVNYAPDAFSILQQLIQQLLQQDTLIILSTPQRLVAKSFITPLLEYCKHSENYSIVVDGVTWETSVFVLQQ